MGVVVSGKIGAGVFPLRIGLVLTQSLQPAAIGNGTVIVAAIGDAFGESFMVSIDPALGVDGHFTALCAGVSNWFLQATKS